MMGDFSLAHADRFYDTPADQAARGSGSLRTGSRDILWLLHTAHEAYLRGELTDVQYIAAVNVTLTADAQRQVQAQDPAAWDRYMVGEAQRLGLLDAEGKLTVRAAAHE